MDKGLSSAYKSPNVSNRYSSYATSDAGSTSSHHRNVLLSLKASLRSFSLKRTIFCQAFSQGLIKNRNLESSFLFYLKARQKCKSGIFKGSQCQCPPLHHVFNEDARTGAAFGVASERGLPAQRFSKLQYFRRLLEKSTLYCSL
jgi:hypothetical protein